MKISILLPVFNTAPFLRECLDSILAQTETDWELLAVDDFSTDESLAILSEYARLDSRIRFFQNDKKGIVPALRLALKNATGDLVTRMDSDDRMRPEKLAALKSLLLKHGKGHVATGMIAYFSKTGVAAGYRRYADWLNKLTYESRNFEEIYKECTVPSPCWMCWRSDLERVGGFDEEVYPEDYDLVFRWRQAGYEIVASREVLHLWRDHPDRASRTNPLYLDNSYLDLKTRWFFRLDRQPERPLVLWGAGSKGKRLANLVAVRNEDFFWVTNNPAKWGKKIAGLWLENFEVVAGLKNPQIIVAVAAPDDQRKILHWLERQRFVAGEHYFFFC
ncbi:MAG: glycosyltransferase family 2 protein [Bacteroidota bacterium]